MMNRRSGFRDEHLFEDPSLAGPLGSRPVGKLDTFVSFVAGA
jgi:hypothetical protein